MRSDRRSFRGRALFALSFAAIGAGGVLVACNVVAGLSDFKEVDCDDVHVLCLADGTAPIDAPIQDTSHGDDTPDQPDVQPIDAGPLNPHRVWAHWPMPNPADAGLPHPAHYDDAGGATVNDLVTSLEWEKSPNKFDVFNEAQRYCAQTTIGGKNGWRLPTRVELLSIVNTTRQDPAMESPPFEKGAAAASTQKTWTASPVAGSAGHYWTVDFQNGTLARDQAATAKAVTRCVRGGAP